MTTSTESNMTLVFLVLLLVAKPKTSYNMVFPGASLNAALRQRLAPSSNSAEALDMEGQLKQRVGEGKTSSDRE